MGECTMSGGMMDGGMMGLMGAGMLLWTLAAVAFIVLTVVATIYLVKRWGPTAPPDPKGRSGPAPLGTS